MVDWPTVLEACSQNMKKQVRPLFGSNEAKTGFGVGAGGDIRSKIDLAAEKALFETLEHYGVSCTVVSEESGVREIGSVASQFYVTTDPVDGTTNAVRGLPFLGVSIAVSRKPTLSTVEIALVADALRDITYTAQKGSGAYKNGEKIRPSETETLESAVVGVDFSAFKTRQVVGKLIKVLQKARHLRHLGANALELCYVADGTTDAFIDIRKKLRVTDIAAAQLILGEAGGIITKPSGENLDAPLTPTQRVSFVAAANRSIHAAIQDLMRNKPDNQ